MFQEDLATSATPGVSSAETLVTHSARFASGVTSDASDVLDVGGFFGVM